MKTSKRDGKKGIYHYLFYFIVGYIILYIISFIFRDLLYVVIISILLIIFFNIGLYRFLKKSETNENLRFNQSIIIKFKTVINKYKYLIGRISIKISSIYGYLPIILGILAPMLFLIIPSLYFSWLLFGTGNSLNSWALYYYLIPTDKVTVWIVSEIIIFCLGFGIFLAGLIAMIRGKNRGDKLIKTGIYKYIRHPQNLGIIIFSLPFMLYIPGFKDIGIRIGDILSWSCFVFLQILSSFFEEKSLLKRNSTEFLKYYLKTGFIFPKLITKNPNFPEFINYKKKFVLSVALFIVFIIIFQFLVQFFSPSFTLFR